MISVQPLDQAYIKRHNIESLLSMLERCQPVSRSELAKLTEMSSASVTRFTGALTSLGLVNETSASDSTGRAASQTRHRSVSSSLIWLQFGQIQLILSTAYALRAIFCARSVSLRRNCAVPSAL